jgi:hypothetical protein
MTDDTFTPLVEICGFCVDRVDNFAAQSVDNCVQCGFQCAKCNAASHLSPSSGTNEKLHASVSLAMMRDVDDTEKAKCINYCLNNGGAVPGCQTTDGSYTPQSATGAKLGFNTTSRDDLPTFTRTAKGNITYRQVGIGYNDEAKQMMAHAYQQYHSGLQFDIGDDDGSVTHFTLELWDNHSFSLVPDDWDLRDKNNPRPIWNGSHNVIVYTKGTDEAHWGAAGQSRDPVTLAIDLASSDLEDLMQYVVKWINNPLNRLYLPFTVWKTEDGSTGKRHPVDRICDSFAEDVYNYLAKKYPGKFTSMTPKRNYAPIISPDFDYGNPVLVNASTHGKELKDFYDQLRVLGNTRAVYAAVYSQLLKGSFFLPYPDPHASLDFPSQYIELKNFRGTSAYGLTKYSEMAVPASA